MAGYCRGSVARAFHLAFVGGDFVLKRSDLLKKIAEMKGDLEELRELRDAINEVLGERPAIQRIPCDRNHYPDDPFPPRKWVQDHIFAIGDMPPIEIGNLPNDLWMTSPSGNVDVTS